MLVSKIIPTKVAFIAAGTFNPQYIRSYETDPTVAGVEALRSSTRDGTNLSVNALAGVASNIIRPSSQPTALANIVSGWGEDRYRFMAAFDVHMTDGSVKKQILSGYTNYMGVSHTGSVDPNMQLHINSSMVLRPSRVQTNRGETVQYHQVSNANVLVNHNQYSADAMQQQVQQCTQRPQDVYDTLSANSDAMRDGVEEVLDFRTRMTVNAVNSRRSNNSVSNYLSNCLTAHRSAIRDVSESSHKFNVLEEASGYATDVDIARDPIMLTLSFSSNTSYRNTGVVTYGDMCTVAPGFDEMAFIMNKGQIHNAGVDVNRMPHEVGSTEAMHAPTHDNVAVTILANAITANMADTLLTGVIFTATNHTQTGEIMVKMDEARTFMDGIDVTSHGNYFMNAIKTGLMDVSFGNTRPFMVSVRADIYGETRIELSLDGAQAVPYCIPSFADSILSPVLCQNNDALRTVSTDIENVSTNIQSNMLGNSYNPYLTSY